MLQYYPAQYNTLLFLLLNFFRQIGFKENMFITSKGTLSLRSIDHCQSKDTRGMDRYTVSTSTTKYSVKSQDVT